jgi:hypothetical protein
MTGSADIARRISKGLAEGSRSPLVQWLAEHRGEIAEAIRGRRPNWTLVARILAEEGVMDVSGKPATGAAVRQAWLRVANRKPARPEPAPKRLPDPAGDVIFVTDPAPDPEPAAKPAEGERRKRSTEDIWTQLERRSGWVNPGGKS